ncbi:MAG TPA: DNA cytosine methyltransferase [Gammaproteobacteria bacterium]|nr:DNA cytosine methyltransferase [Gammaproteobacteria bacterium]
MKQAPLLLGHEIVVDLFAGGGGASTGIENGIGRPVDIAVNHDPLAIAMHRINHPHTRHFCESVFKVNPREVTGNRPVGLLWASPDCTHHSKAKGGKPVSNKRRGLAWVVIKWARRVRPRVIKLENVEEFADWGPLTPEGKPDKVRKGQTFLLWVSQLERLGYRVEWRELRGCDYGAPTIRKRLFVIARCDGLPIAWPAPTHGIDLLPVRTAAECIDWSIPCPSIFERRRPLADNTLRRIAKGVVRYVLESDEPFLVNLTHGGRDESISAPFRTITGANRGEKALVVPTLVQTGYGERQGQAPRVPGLQKPLGTVVAGGSKHALVAAFLAKHYGGVIGHGVDRPAGTITTQDHHAVVAAHLLNQKGTAQQSRDLNDPAPTICASTTHAGVVAAFLSTYYGNSTFVDPRDPTGTVTTKDRLQLVTINIDGETYVIDDIGMRMLQPRELFRAQGFDDDYVIDRGIDVDGNEIKLTKTAQVRMCGNSVCPPVAEALVRANFTHEDDFMEAAAA